MIIKDVKMENMDGKEFELEIYMNAKSVMGIERDLKAGLRFCFFI